MVRLPVEYQEVEYLESTGTQWINTGIPLSRIIDINVNWTLRFSLTVIRTQILGGANAFNKQIVVIQSHVRRDWVSTSNHGTFSPVLSTDAIYEISQRDGYYELTDKNGNVESKEITLYSSNSYPFILFAKSMDAKGTAVETSTIAYMKLYSFRIYEDNTMIANFIPCYRKSDNEPGMYDAVSKTFYTNSGTGTFLVGNDAEWEAIDLLALRRMIIMGVMKNMGTWKQKTISAEYNITNGDSLKTWLNSLVPSGASAYLICRDNLDTSTFVNSQFICSTYMGGRPNGVVRYRDGIYAQMTYDSMSTAYAFMVNQGEKYTIFYQ